MCDLMAHLVKLRVMYIMALQLLDKCKKSVPFGAIKHSAEDGIFHLAVYFVTIENAMDLYSMW